MMKSRVLGWSLLVVLGLFAGAMGCATKKFVQAKLDPLSERVTGIEKQSKESADAVGELQTSVSRNREAAITADQRGGAAAAEATKAGQSAAKAGVEAEEAKTLAKQGLSGLNELGRRIDSLNKYELVAEETVFFDFESSLLEEGAKARLDQAVSRLALSRPYLIEVRGCTDNTGGQEYNLALSRKRAEAVARYLATRHNIPLYRIHVLGMGSEQPAADNSTREGRKQNRRVEVKLYAAGL